MATSKQSKAIQIYVEAHGTLSVSESMRRAGYSDATAKNPKQLTRTMDWKDAMDEFLPDVDLLAKHAALMEAKTLARADFPLWVPQERIKEIIEEAGCQIRNSETNLLTGVIAVWYWAPDTKAQTAALALAYKLKGKLVDRVAPVKDPDGLFNDNNLTITVVDAEHNVQS